MGKELYTDEQLKLAEKWEKVIETANIGASNVKAEFKENLWLIGWGTAIAAAFNTAVGGGFYGTFACVAMPIILAGVAQVKSARSQDFYDNFASHCTKQYKEVLNNYESVEKGWPVFDDIKQDFQDNHFKRLSLVSALKSFRTAIIASVVGVGVTAYSQSDIVSNWSLFRDERNEENENSSQASEYAPLTSPHPVPRPAR